MKTLFKIAFILAGLILAACNEKEPLPKDEWVKVDSITPSDTVNKIFNKVYHNDNHCLSGFDEDTVFFMCFTSEDYRQTDTCVSLPDIDFDKMTLVVGKIMEPSISYRIDSVVLYQNSFRKGYKFDVHIDTCIWCWSVIDWEFFSRLYPKLRNDFTFEFNCIKE